MRLRDRLLRLRHAILVSVARENRKLVDEVVPSLGKISRGSCSINEELKAHYREYTNRVSSDSMAISYELACLLWTLCEATEPRRILDMGSGFSSFVFRRYQLTAGLRPEVWSVDEDGSWLDKTGDYLGSHGLSNDNLYTWDEFRKMEPGSFDLISHDLGYMEDRPQVFEGLLGLRQPDGLIVIDDIQKPQYREGIAEKLRQHDSVEGFYLRRLTLDKHLRYAMLVKRRPTSEIPETG